ncbi:MAG: hypothetical protein J0H65_15430 [Rhizobiales bacterium]|nr:hypothetical protein [Hyphomicrobiales bacterium]
MLVQYFRLSLKPVDLPDAFGSINPEGRPYSREEWLRLYFSEERVFEHRGNTFLYVPARDAPRNLPASLIVGYIARQRLLNERTPPSAGFEPTEHGSWQGALLVVDPTHHDDGQKLAMEVRTEIGKPLSVLNSLADGMRLSPDLPPPFDVQVHPIAEMHSFWRFAEQHDYQINWIMFDVAPPNMFGGADDFSNELRQLRDKNRVNRVKATLSSDSTIDVKQPNIEEVVDYTEMGAGSIKAKTTGNQFYNSRDHVKSDRIETEQGREDFWDRLLSWMGERF